MITDPRKDPFGQAMLDYYNGQLNASIQVLTDLAEPDFIPISYFFRNASTMPSWELTALEACEGEVLDIGAGAGSHSLLLQAKGYEVWAMDNSLGAVAVMNQRGIKNVIHCDLWDYHEKQFDTLLLLMNGIGIVGNLEGLDRFLVQIKSLLRPNGQILLDSSNIAYMFEGRIQELADNQGDYYGIVKHQVIYQNKASATFDWLFVDFPRLKQHATHNGYSCELLEKGDHYEYLVKLIPNGQISV